MYNPCRGAAAPHGTAATARLQPCVGDGEPCGAVARRWVPAPTLIAEQAVSCFWARPPRAASAGWRMPTTAATKPRAEGQGAQRAAAPGGSPRAEAEAPLSGTAGSRRRHGRAVCARRLRVSRAGRERGWRAPYRPPPRADSPLAAPIRGRWTRCRLRGSREAEV